MSLLMMLLACNAPPTPVPAPSPTAPAAGQATTARVPAPAVAATTVTEFHRDDTLWVGQFDDTPVAIVTTTDPDSTIEAIRREPVPYMAPTSAVIAIPHILARNTPGYPAGDPRLSLEIHESDVVAWRVEAGGDPMPGVGAILTVLADPTPAPPDFVERTVVGLLGSGRNPSTESDDLIVSMLGTPANYQWVIATPRDRDQVLDALRRVLGGPPAVLPEVEQIDRVRGRGGSFAQMLLSGELVNVHVSRPGAPNPEIAAVQHGTFDLIESALQAEATTQGVSFDTVERQVGIHRSDLQLQVKTSSTDGPRLATAFFDRLATLYVDGVPLADVDAAMHRQLGPELDTDPFGAITHRLRRGAQLVPDSTPLGMTAWRPATVTLGLTTDPVAGDDLLAPPHLIDQTTTLRSVSPAPTTAQPAGTEDDEAAEDPAAP